MSIKSSLRKIFNHIAPKMLLHYDAYQHLLNNSDSYLHTSGWMESLEKASPRNANGSYIPWMNFSIIEILEERLHKELTLFEFGSGFSTLFFANLVKAVDSVEYDDVWFQKIVKNLPVNANIIFQGKDIDGSYCRTVTNRKLKYDVIIVDGRDRVNCVVQGIQCLTSTGVILLDDSHRERYLETFSIARRSGFKCLTISGLKPNGTSRDQTTVFYRNGNCLNI